jgi:antirestriction protein ArdC
MQLMILHAHWVALVGTKSAPWKKGGMEETNMKNDRDKKVRKDTTEDTRCRARGPPVPSWESILRRAIITPGLIHEAYTRFHRFSLRNQLLAMAQCLDRRIAPGPLATFKQWAALGRHVVRGQKALVLCVPVTIEQRPASTEDDDAANGGAQESSRVLFMYRARWFVLAQTDGDPYTPVALPSWSEERALAALGITRIPFDHLDGNTQGYATAHREVAINPVAALPHKTLFHEVAHVLLGHAKDATVSRSLREVEAEGVALLCCEALGLDGSEYARGYLQHWRRTEEIPEQSAQRIITTAHRILHAGEQDGAPS